MFKLWAVKNEWIKEAWCGRPGLACRSEHRDDKSSQNEMQTDNQTHEADWKNPTEACPRRDTSEKIIGGLSLISFTHLKHPPTEYKNEGPQYSIILLEQLNRHDRTYLGLYLCSTLWTKPSNIHLQISVNYIKYQPTWKGISECGEWTTGWVSK